MPRKCLQELEKNNIFLENQHTSQWRVPSVIAGGLTDPLEPEVELEKQLRGCAV